MNVEALYRVGENVWFIDVGDVNLICKAPIEAGLHENGEFIYSLNRKPVPERWVRKGTEAMKLALEEAILRMKLFEDV